MRAKILLAATYFFCMVINTYSQATWSTLNNSPFNSYRHEDVWFINENTGWLGASSMGIWKTSDGGITWQQQLQISQIRSIGFADSLYGWAGNVNGSPSNSLYQTTNGGINWNAVTHIPSPGPSGICGIWVWNRDVVNATGKYSTPSRFIRTTNAGVNWTCKDMSAYANSLVDCYFYSRDSGFAVGYKNEGGGKKGVILWTPDGGETWVTRYTTTETIDFGWKISFPTALTGYAAMETFSSSRPQLFLKTTDGGFTWNENVYQPTNIGIVNIQGMGFIDPNTGWVGTFNGLPYKTTNGGISWQQESFGSKINRIRFLNDSLGYAVGQKVYKFSRQGPLVIDPHHIFPSSFKLYQNFPNPFNPTTSIIYEIPTKTNVRVLIYDLKGRVIKEIINKMHEPGRYSIYIDGGQMASGIYLYKLIAGDNSISKKMILLK